MKNGASIVVDHSQKLASSLRKLVSKRTLVGYPAANAARGDGPITNAALGYIHENGAPEAGIPPRPHLGPGVESVKGKLTEKFRQVAEAALDGEAEKMDRGFEQAGLIAQAAIRRKITEGVPPPLKPATIAARKKRGRTGTKPLIDTAQLRNAVSYVVRSAK